MVDKITIDGGKNALRADAPLVADGTARTGVASIDTPRMVLFASDEEVELAAEKVFRLHARLFEELAK